MPRHALSTVFTRPVYVAVSGVVTVVLSVGLLLAANRSMLWYAWTSDVASWQYAGSVTWNVLLGTPTSLGWWTVGSIILTAALVGVLISMFHYAWRHAQVIGVFSRASSSAGGGLLAATFGVGCAACAPLILGSVLAATGATGLILLLPFHGAELSVVALLLLGYALYSLARVIERGRVCPS